MLIYISYTNTANWLWFPLINLDELLMTEFEKGRLIIMYLGKAQKCPMGLPQPLAQDLYFTSTRHWAVSLWEKLNYAFLQFLIFQLLQPPSVKMAAKGIFVFLSLCLIAFAIGKPQNQVIMLIMSHNYYTVAAPNLLGKKPATRMPIQTCSNPVCDSTQEIS